MSEDIHHHENSVQSKRSILPIFLGGIFLMALFGLLVKWLMVAYPEGPSDEQIRAEERAKNLVTLREENSASLDSAAWVDQNTGVVRLPIQVAMDLTIVALNNKEVVAAGPVDAPAVPVTEAPAATESAPVEDGASVVVEEPSAVEVDAETGVEAETETETTEAP